MQVLSDTNTKGESRVKQWTKTPGLNILSNQHVLYNDGVKNSNIPEQPNLAQKRLKSEKP